MALPNLSRLSFPASVPAPAPGPAPTGRLVVLEEDAVCPISFLEMKRGCLAWQPTVERQGEEALEYAPALLQNEPNQYYDIVSFAQYVQERLKEGRKVISPVTSRVMTARDQYDLLQMANQIATRKELFSEQYYETQLNDDSAHEGFNAEAARPKNMLPDDYNDPFTELTTDNIPLRLKRSANSTLDAPWDKRGSFERIHRFESLTLWSHPVALPSPLALRPLLDFLQLKDVPDIPVDVVSGALRELAATEGKPADLAFMANHLSPEAKAYIVYTARDFVGSLLSPSYHEHGVLTTAEHQHLAVRYVVAEKIDSAIDSAINSAIRARVHSLPVPPPPPPPAAARAMEQRPLLAFPAAGGGAPPEAADVGTIFQCVGPHSVTLAPTTGPSEIVPPNHWYAGFVVGDDIRSPVTLSVGRNDTGVLKVQLLLARARRHVAEYMGSENKDYRELLRKLETPMKEEYNVGADPNKRTITMVLKYQDMEDAGTTSYFIPEFTVEDTRWKGTDGWPPPGPQKMRFLSVSDPRPFYISE